MAVTLLSEMYEPVRSLTGNDDPTLGVELLPDTRLAVLIKSAIRTLRTYSESFPAVSVIDTGNGVLGVVTVEDPTAGLTTDVFNAVTLAAAHKFFVSIGYKLGVQEILGAVAKTAELISGIENQLYVTVDSSS